MASLSGTVYGGQYRDSTPQVKAAGKIIAPPRSTAKECIATALETPRTPEIIRKFHPMKYPDVGAERVHFGRVYDDTTVAEGMRHGVSTTNSLDVSGLANPPRKTNFQQQKAVIKDQVYASSKTAPTGRSHDQSPGLPKTFEPMETTFGRRTKYDGTVQEAINPDKSPEEVEQESSVGHEMYATTHGDYNVGERVDRRYDWSTYSKDFKYGIETPCDPRGIHVAASFRWLPEARDLREVTLTSDRYDTFQEKYTHQLGKGLDPLKETRDLPEDHVFGLLFPPDEFGAADLIHNRKQMNFLRGHDRLRGAVAALRHQLKKLNYQRFTDLQAAFRHYDKEGRGKISALRLREVCKEYGVPVEDEVLLTLVDWCDADGDGLIDYEDFADFLNWRSKLPEGPMERMMKPEVPTPSRTPSEAGSKEGSTRVSFSAVPMLDDSPKRRRAKSARQIDPTIGGHFTWSKQINSVVGGVKTEDWRSYGIPTVRNDLAAPRLRRVSDRRNYGDESDAHALINPSVYSNAGVTSRDFFQPRSKEEIRRIFSSMGVDLSDETFTKFWEEAKAKDANGMVCMESFREVIEQAHTEHLQLQGQLVSPGRREKSTNPTTNRLNTIPQAKSEPVA